MGTCRRAILGVRRLDHVVLQVRPEAVLRPENRAKADAIARSRCDRARGGRRRQSRPGWRQRRRTDRSDAWKRAAVRNPGSSRYSSQKPWRARLLLSSYRRLGRRRYGATDAARRRVARHERAASPPHRRDHGRQRINFRHPSARAAARTGRRDAPRPEPMGGAHPGPRDQLYGRAGAAPGQRRPRLDRSGRRDLERFLRHDGDDRPAVQREDDGGDRAWHRRHADPARCRTSC